MLAAVMMKLINSYLAFFSFLFNMTTLLQLGVYVPCPPVAGSLLIFEIARAGGRGVISKGFWFKNP